MRRRVWEDVPADEGRVSATAAALRVPPVIARLLVQRGFDDVERAYEFLHPSIDRLHNPFLLQDMQLAVSRILAAVQNHEPIAVHGDYDVDGVTSTAILRRAIELLGGNVTHFVPHRHRDGYGLQAATIERLHADGARLVVSVDCGIRATEAALRARDLGVDLIITDHHEPESALPPALAVLNPKRVDCSYPDKGLAGVGVALKLVQALLSASGRGAEHLQSFLKIAAIGTLADVVPLTGENRVIAHCGLAALSRGPHAAGLEMLLAESGLTGKTLDSFHVSFILAPRLNAAGRMGSADAALDLLLIKGRDQPARDRAQVLARQLNEENARRQAEEAEIVSQARHLVDGDPDIGAQNLLVVAGDGWHRGVIGIAASKLVDAYHKPSLVLSIADGVAHGSGRSIPQFNLLEALESVSDVFLKFGGHKQAAGVTLEASRVPELRKRLTAYANARLEPDDLVPRLRIDAPLGLGEISGEVVESLQRLGPFGAANPKPVFRASPVDLVTAPRRLKERHLSLLFKQSGRSFRAIAWRGIDKETYLNTHRAGLELAYSLDQSEYQGQRTMELTVADVRLPSLVAEGA
ncbi:MAG TPA: single-stranded-DNA-specific exonuclease RecJ [Vicinamibacterales bacterium]|nr:single-stranded-DNA-specific exonuclease RecJ [Vicinamibacterales bacterium]